MTADRNSRVGSLAQEETDSVLSYLSQNKLPVVLLSVGGLLLFWPALARLVEYCSFFAVAGVSFLKLLE